MKANKVCVRWCSKFKIINGLLLFLFTTIAQPQKFAPEDGKCLVFVGQDLTATGGLDKYTEGYTDYFETPAGVTIYTNLSPGNNSYGHFNKGLDGLEHKANWGSGDSWAAAYLNDTTYNKSAMAIGLSFVNHEVALSKGKHDALIRRLAEWIKQSKRPIFLRIGYEFDGWEWNHYKRKAYLKTWKRIHTIFHDLEVNNVAFVWQSKGQGSNQKVLEKWYPGDDLVDWVGYSYFDNPDSEMLKLARRHQKPVFIAEATPVRANDNLYFETDLKNKKLEKVIWTEWFEPFFNTIHTNSDVIKAFNYINSNWSSQPMWANNPVFQKVDSRLQMSIYVVQKWKEELNLPNYIHANDLPWGNFEEHYE